MTSSGSENSAVYVEDMVSPHARGMGMRSVMVYITLLSSSLSSESACGGGCGCGERWKDSTSGFRVIRFSGVCRKFTRAVRVGVLRRKMVEVMVSAVLVIVIMMLQSP